MIERVWFGSDRFARTARAILAPAERVYAGVSGLRSLMYDAGWAHAETPSIPVVSVGNITVGGAGKTPIAAWIATWCRDHGARPAIVMRGYGGDEAAVHRALNPDVPVVTDADRARGVAHAAANGATIAVLDDAFQHRRLRRSIDIVVVSADQWSDDPRLLPAGPWREPLSALARADLIIVTRKAASAANAEAVHRRLSDEVRDVPRVSIHLSADGVVDARSGEARPIASLAGARVVAVAAVGDPRAFERQLDEAGARVMPMRFRDHHPYTDDDVAAIVAAARGDAVVCTLKDIGKLRDRWPRGGPSLWYVSQRVTVERGVGGLETLLESAMRAPSADAPPAAGGLV